jgi:hypothetical protein
LERLAGNDVRFTQQGSDLQVELAGETYAIYRVVK